MGVDGWADGVQVDRCEDDGEGGVDGRTEDEVAGGDETVVEDVLDVGQGGEAAEGGGVFIDRVRSTGGVDDGEAEVVVALEETGPCGAGVGLGTSGDGGVAIDDKITMRDDVAGVDGRFESVAELGGEGRGGGCEEAGEEFDPGVTVEEGLSRAGSGSDSGRRSREDGCTSQFGLRSASA